jgi:hypothetical protein
MPFFTLTPKRVQSFDMIQSDVWGMAPIISHANYKYFITFIDDYNRFTWIHFLCSKRDFFKLLHEYIQTNFLPT